MSNGIKQLGKHTVIYGLGYVLTRLIPFLLTPFYTNTFESPDQFGIIVLVFTDIAFMNVIYRYGIDSAFLRFFSKKDSRFNKGAVFSTAISSLVLTGILFSTLIFLFSNSIASVLPGLDGYGLFVKYASIILFLDTFIAIPLLYLRMKNRPLVFMGIMVTNVSINLISNIILIGFLDRGIEGAFISNIIASSFSFLVLIPLSLKNWNFNFSTKLWTKMMRFGTPFIFSGIAIMVLELIGRNMLEIFTDTATQGIYSSGYKLGIFMLVIVTAFKFAWQPFFLGKDKDPEAPRLFSRILTVFSFVMVSAFLIISFFIHQIIHFKIGSFYILGESYWQAESVVPIILASYIFLGFYINFQPPIFFTERTWVFPFITGSAAIVNIFLNIVLIQKIGMLGSAYATLFSYIWMSALTYFVVRKWYKIPYEWGKIFGLFISAGFVTFLFYFYSVENILIKLLLLSVFFISVFGFRILSLKQLLIFVKMKNK
ncbi:MAG: oligosaccharide flippase family protein [Candidatus Marinimicrobia bacterium]|nr:oligosaccharide flippase family protein [Candidatus Neomarinimicrobiota bacterium]